MTPFEQVPPEERHEEVPLELPSEERVFMVPTCPSPFETVLQEKVGADGPVGYEILVRRLGTDVVPREELEQLRENGGLIELTSNMFHEADRQSVLVGKPIAVNVSPSELTQELLEHLRILQAGGSGVEERVEIEITEEAPLSEAHVPVLSAIADLGFRLSIDDFGSGYATMETLEFLLARGVPIHTVKIDKSLVDEGRAGATARALLGKVAQVVVEGVETREQLKDLPPEVVVQGFVNGKPRSVTSVLLDRAA